METKLSGADILLQSLLNHDTNTIFGYPGSCVMAILDCLYKNEYPINHILTRHEQGAIHAAQGYAQVSHKVGVAITTSGPGATNAVTGIADAMANSTPLVVITGQVHSALLGTKAFQEVDILSITHSITKWGYQICSAKEISSAIAHAFFVASTGRPGPVLLDITKDAQVESAMYLRQKTDFTQTHWQKPNTTKYPDYNITNASGVNNKIADEVLKLVEDKNTILVLDLEEDHSTRINRSHFNKVIQSKKFGSIGFGLPAAIGAKYAATNQTVCLVTNNSRFQATVQELGVIIQSGIELKIILLQDESFTRNGMEHPNFTQLTNAYCIESRVVFDKNQLKDGIEKMLLSKGAYLLDIKIKDN